MKDSGSRPFEKNGMYPEEYTREFWNKKSGYLAKQIIERVHPVRVLDIGCARGYLVEDLRRMGVEAYGCDISQFALDTASKKSQRFLLIHDISSPVSLPFANSAFDLVVCSAIPYIEEKLMDMALEKIRRVTRKWLMFFAYYKEGDTYIKMTDVWRKISWSLKAWNAKLLKHDFEYHGDYLYKKT